MNQYERGVHTPNYQMTEKFADVLKVPVEYLYAKDDATAQLLLSFHRLDQAGKNQALEFISCLSKL